MRRNAAIVLAVFALCLSASVLVAAPAAPADNFSISWWTVDGGGGASQGGPYALSGSIGQADAGSAAGGNYILTGGFWSDAFQDFSIYLPVIIK
jgi:hypothetical protein